jgi:hypothetical protein
LIWLKTDYSVGRVRGIPVEPFQGSVIGDDLPPQVSPAAIVVQPLGLFASCNFSLFTINY